MPKIRPNYYRRHPHGTQKPSASQVGEPSGEPVEEKPANKKAGK